MERKHRFICRFASNICNTAVYEHTLLQECLAEELFHLKQPGVFANGIFLIDAHPPKKQFHSLMEQSFGHVIPIDSLQVASRCQLQKSLCTKQNIVLATPFQAMEALAFVSYKGNVFAFLQLLELAEDAKNIGACFWIQSEKRYLVPAENILCPLIYNKDQDKIKTLIPWQVRRFLKQWTLHSYLKKCAAAFLFASLISFWLQASLAADGKLHWLLTAKLHWLLLASLIGF